MYRLRCLVVVGALLPVSGWAQQPPFGGPYADGKAAWDKAAVYVGYYKKPNKKELDFYGVLTITPCHSEAMSNLAALERRVQENEPRPPDVILGYTDYTLCRSYRPLKIISGAWEIYIFLCDHAYLCGAAQKFGMAGSGPTIYVQFWRVLPTPKIVENTRRR